MPELIDIHGYSAETVYNILLNKMKLYGKIHGKTRELLNVNLIIYHPTNNFIRLRKNWAWCTWEMFDRLDPDFKNPGHSYIFRPNWQRKLEKEGGTFNYTYGDAYKKHIPDVLNRLRSKSTRECVLTMWQNSYLTDPGRTPCTLTLHFMIREERLHLFVTMRTNDVINLLPYDIWQHTTLQMVIASLLGLKLGDYHHHVHQAYWQKKRDNMPYVNNAIDILSNSERYDLPPDDISYFEEDLKFLIYFANSALAGKFSEIDQLDESKNLIKSTLIREWLFVLISSYAKFQYNNKIEFQFTRPDFKFIYDNL